MKHATLLLLIVLSGKLFAQEEVVKIFNDTRIVNSYSVEMQPKGTMKFIISHRFDPINTGGQNLWGLDNSRIRIGLDYAPFETLNIGVGRSSQQKNFDVFLKYQLMKQTTTSPVSLVVFSETSFLTDETATRDFSFTNKLTYTTQLLIARKLHERLSIQLMPTYLHRNFVNDLVSDHDIFSMGSAIRFQASKRIAVQLEHFYVLPDQLGPDDLGNERTNSLGVGVEIETKGHIFQLNLTNSRDFVAPFYLGETIGDFLDGVIHFGFNITRDFKVGSRKYN